MIDSVWSHSSDANDKWRQRTKIRVAHQITRAVAISLPTPTRDIGIIYYRHRTTPRTVAERTTGEATTRKTKHRDEELLLDGSKEECQLSWQKADTRNLMRIRLRLVTILLLPYSPQDNFNSETYTWNMKYNTGWWAENVTKSWRLWRQSSQIDDLITGRGRKDYQLMS